MSRSRRIEYSGAWYHVSNHGISGQLVFDSNDHFRLFCELLNDVHRMFDTEVHAFVFMHDCYHLLIHTRNANLSKVMRYINGVYTQRYNRSRSRKGPLFCGRYKSVLFHPDTYLFQVSRYIHYLPVINKLCKRPEEYAWSSYPVYKNLCRKPPWLVCNHILERFELQNKVTSYSSYTDCGVDAKISSFYCRKHISPILGPESFVQNIKSNFCVASNLIDVITENKPSVLEVLDYVKDRYNDTNHEFSGIDSLTMNKIAILIGKEIVGHKLKDIAEALDIDNPRSISVIARRFKQKIQSDNELSEFYYFVRDKFSVELC